MDDSGKADKAEKAVVWIGSAAAATVTGGAHQTKRPAR